jgi:hypothetical protein
MNIEGCNAPTRQNIKSHLQKYRLLLQKRSKNAAAAGTSSGGAGAACGGRIHRPKDDEEACGANGRD